MGKVDRMNGRRDLRCDELELAMRGMVHMYNPNLHLHLRLRPVAAPAFPSSLQEVQ